MKLDTYIQAKQIKDSIQHFNVKKTQIELMKERPDDRDFNLLRELAHSGVCFAIEKLEKDFNNL